MFRSLNIAATGMAAQETKLDTISNNLANVNTTGYKRQDAEFEDLLYQNIRGAGTNPAGGTQPSGTQVGTGVRIVATSRSFSQGATQQTGNPLDIAIEGAGFLAVQKSAGEIGYTRAGSLKIDATGRLCTNDGLSVEPAINIPLDATAVTIGADGQVSATTAGGRTTVQVGQLQVATFPNPNGLEATGHNLFVPTQASGEPTTGAPGSDGRGTILQGSLEGSNVEMVTEMVDLIRVQRGYEINSKVISAADDMLRNATQVR
jgi:flagellar basal-body rod protein FlgG